MQWLLIGIATGYSPMLTRSAVRPAAAAARGVQRIRMMAVKTGIVGLPNVGKSTLFNALMEDSNAEAANYPFCTIEPNTGIVSVPDSRLNVLADINKSVKIVPTSLSFVDIAGLVEGASKGEGLGNQFLANIRECDAIVHVVRCFVDDNIVHVSGSVDPLRDIEVITLELVLADLAQVEKRLQRVQKDAKSKKDGAAEELAVLEKLVPILDAGTPARKADIDPESWNIPSIKSLGLLSAKPVIYAANVADGDLAEGNEMVDRVKELAAKEGASVVVVSAQVEAELVELDAEERANFLEELGVQKGETGLEKLIREAYSLLDLRTYFTSGVTETRAWTIKAGDTAPQAAGVIHTDFEKGFIRAETIAYADYVECGSEKVAKEKGKLRAEGKEYVVEEGDVLHFLTNK
jgi:GTP-binding protein YchF